MVLSSTASFQTSWSRVVIRLELGVVVPVFTGRNCQFLSSIVLVQQADRDFVLARTKYIPSYASQVLGYWRWQTPVLIPMVSIPGLLCAVNEIIG